jgi:hypothetical protein
LSDQLLGGLAIAGSQLVTFGQFGNDGGVYGVDNKRSIAPGCEKTGPARRGTAIDVEANIQVDSASVICCSNPDSSQSPNPGFSVSTGPGWLSRIMRRAACISSWKVVDQSVDSSFAADSASATATGAVLEIASIKAIIRYRNTPSLLFYFVVLDGLAFPIRVRPLLLGLIVPCLTDPKGSLQIRGTGNRGMGFRALSGKPPYPLTRAHVGSPAGANAASCNPLHGCLVSH